jgi:hypothetical protein
MLPGHRPRIGEVEPFKRSWTGQRAFVRARAAELGFPNACDPAAPVSGEMTDLHDAAALRQDTRVRERR